VLAGVVLGTESTVVADRTQGEMEIETLGVARDARNRGIGELLVRELIHAAHDRAADALVVWTRPSMRTAQRLYDRIGFVRTPERDFPRDGQTMLTYRFPMRRSARQG